MKAWLRTSIITTLPVSVIFLSTQALCIDYFKPGFCPKELKEIPKTIGAVDERLLPQTLYSQGKTGTCGFHAATVLANSIFKYNLLQQSENHPLLKKDLSPLDAVFKIGKCEPIPEKPAAELFLSGKPVSLNFSNRPPSVVLMELAKKGSLKLNSESMTVGKADVINRALYDQSKRCKNEECLCNHGLCIKSVCEKYQALVPSFGEMVDDWELIAEKVSKEKTLPIQHFISSEEVPIPPFAILPKDFSTLDEKGRKEAIISEIVRYFSDSKNPHFPVNLNTCTAENDQGKCVGFHAIAATKLEHVECQDESGKTISTFYRFIPLDSTLQVHPLMLEDVAQGMAKYKMGMIQIKPNPAQGPQGIPIANEDDPAAFPLWHYVAARDIPNVKRLLAEYKNEGRDVAAIVNQTGYIGMSPLHMAVETENEELVDALLGVPGINVNQPHLRGGFPLATAINDKRLEIVVKLLSHGANPNQRFPDGTSPLYLALQSENETIISTLIHARGTNLNEMFSDGYTPLSYAIFHKKTGLAKMLLAAGANTEPGTNGWSPLAFAADLGQKDMVIALLDAGAKIDQPNSGGFTPLAQAIFQGQLDAARVLLERGANLALKGNDGRTMEQLAQNAKKNSTELLELLHSHSSKSKIVSP